METCRPGHMAVFRSTGLAAGRCGNRQRSCSMVLLVFLTVARYAPTAPARPIAARVTMESMTGSVRARHTAQRPVPDHPQGWGAVGAGSLAAVR